MGRRWFLVAVVAAAACGRYTLDPAAPTETSSAEAATSTPDPAAPSVVATDTAPHDDPQSCVDPPATTLPPTTLGTLTPQQIQAVVRSHFGEFAGCHQAALRRDPNLHGRVAIGFVIDREGRVENARVAENTLPNCAVASCVRNRFGTLEFPKPEGGVVTVVYPINMAPSD